MELCDYLVVNSDRMRSSLDAFSEFDMVVCVVMILTPCLDVWFCSLHTILGLLLTGKFRDNGVPLELSPVLVSE